MSTIVHRDLGSDNRTGAHPAVLAAIEAANAGHADSYGDDEWTRRLEDLFRHHFGAGARAYPVFNGTAANVLCLELLGAPHGAVVCSAEAHIHVDECGAPERITGMKLLAAETEHGKLTPADVARWDGLRGEVHHPQPLVVSITQCTEVGTVYAPGEIRALADAAHERGMSLHMDGARLANAAAALDLPLAALTTEVGVDAVSFGGTKNGLLFGDVAVLLGAGDEARAGYARKQLMQLASKMRFISAQLEALLGEGEQWRENARRANAMAALLTERVAPLAGVGLAHPVEANMVFARLAPEAITAAREALGGEEPFYVWDEAAGVVRWVCSWDTEADEIDALGAALAGAA